MQHMTPTVEQSAAIGAKLSQAQKVQLRDLLDHAAAIAVHKTKLDPTWPMWRKRLFWSELDPAIAELQERCKAITGRHCAL